MDVWSKIKVRVVLCCVKAEIRNREHSYCGAAKQVKTVWTIHILKKDEDWAKNA